MIGQGVGNLPPGAKHWGLKQRRLAGCKLSPLRNCCGLSLSCKIMIIQMDTFTSYIWCWLWWWWWWWWCLSNDQPYHELSSTAASKVSAVAGAVEEFELVSISKTRQKRHFATLYFEHRPKTNKCKSSWKQPQRVNNCKETNHPHNQQKPTYRKKGDNALLQS